MSDPAVAAPGGTAPGATKRKPLLGKESGELEEIARSLGEQPYRGRQIASWLYAKRARGFDEMTDLPKRFLRLLEERYHPGGTEPIREEVSSDGTRKYLFPTASGFVEAAYIPEEERATLCLSTQVGCRMACRFCATGKQGLSGNLDAGEIVGQFLRLPERERVTNIVYMGMGEPFDNTEAVLASLRLLTDPAGIALGAGRITVSTVGVLPGMAEFLDRSKSHLAVSLHSPFDEERRELMPVEARHPIAEVLDTLARYDFRGSRRLSFEYIMFAGRNDDERHARALVRLLSPLACRVNLIRFHSVPGTPFTGSSREAMEAFQTILKEKGMICTIRKSRGEDIGAACGLLSTREHEQRREQ